MSGRVGRVGALGAAVAALGALGMSACGGAERQVTLGRPVAKRAAVPPGTVAEDFSLHDAHGRLVTLSALHGKVVLLTFLYTHCVDACPGIAHDLNEALRKLGPEKRDARVVAVSVDPKFDTSHAVRRFERAYRLLPQFRYLIGSRAQLKPVWQAYNVLVEPRSSDLFGHSTPIYLLDRGGTPRFSYPAHAEPGTIAAGVRQLLRHQ